MTSRRRGRTPGGGRAPGHLPTRALARVLALLALLALPASLRAQEPVIRRYDSRHGLSVPTVFSLAQDSAGFVWVGTAGGLYRYDGVEMRRWAGRRLRRRVQAIAVTGAGRVLALEERGRLWRIAGDEAVPARGPGGGPLQDVVDVAVAEDGALWVLREDGRPSRREAGGRWRPVDLPEEVLRDGPQHLFRGAGGGVVVSAAREVWSVPRAGTPQRLARVTNVVDVLCLSDGRCYLLTFWRDAFLLEDGRLTEVMDLPGRGIDLERRDGAVWISYDRFLGRLGPDGGVRVLGPDEGIDAGGPLLVDQEGSLWMGTFSGVVQLPEPRTVTWSDRHGLPSAHTRFLERVGDTVWVATWQGTGRLERRGPGWEAASVSGWMSRTAPVADDEGDVWVGTSEGLVEVRAGRGAVVQEPGITAVVGADRASGGGLWLGGWGGVRRVRTEGFGRRREAARPVPGLDVPADVLVTAVLEDGAGRLWVTAGERICRTDARSATAAPDPEWACTTIPGAVHFTALAETATGSIWAASPYAGLLRYRGGSWDPFPGILRLPSRSVLNLAPSPSGGIWVVGHGILWRVAPDPDARDGWRLLERLSGWHGLPTSGAEDVLEDPDSTLWVATSRGVVRVPPAVRRRSPDPPRVALIEARVDDRRLDPALAAELTHEHNRLELRFAALSYRAPSRVRYQVRLSPGSGWSDARAQPVVRWVDLDPGRYRAEIRASLDGVSWTARPASFSFEVLPPWYLEARWIAVFALAGLLVALLLYRARVAHLVGLEQQRTRIAMDLHDKMGAALGSVGIQAGLLARPDLGTERRRRLASEISETTEALGETLADIVWSLDPRASTLEDLAVRLAERGRRLLEGGETEFVAEHPRAWPPDDLPASVRRNVLLVGLEALQNAARHAGADRVVLSLAPVGAGTWRLTVRDDGVGIPSRDADDGMGLLSMRSRAAEIGGEIEWRRPAGAGTEVVLTFPLGGVPPLRRRIRRWVFRLMDRMNVRVREG